MKTKTMNEDLEAPTALQSALTGYELACTDLAEQKAQIAALRTRVAELAGAVADTREKAAQKPCMSSLSLDDIKKLSAKQAALFQELSGLQAAHDCAVKELHDLEREQEGLRLFKVDTAQHVWATLYQDLLKAVDLDLLAKVTAAGFMAGMQRSSISDDLLGEDSLDANLVEGLAQQFGLPL